MDRLWAPWRAQYIYESSGTPPADQACFLCRGLAGTEDRESLLVWRRPASAVFLNRFPYNNGHLLVCPLVHEGQLSALSGTPLTEPVETLRLVVGVLDRL